MTNLSLNAGRRLRRLALLLCASTIPSLVLAPSGLHAQTPAPRVRQVIPVEAGASSEDSTVPQALVLSLHGKCEYSDDDTTFTKLKTGHVLKQGAVVRTGDGGRVDLFFRRIGTSVRLQPGTEVVLEKMDRHMSDGEAVMDTLLNLRSGRIFTVVRSHVPGSTFEIRNAAGRSVVESGEAEGQYIITADGTHVTEKHSAANLKVVGETGITVVSPGMKFSPKDGAMNPVKPKEAVKALIEFDQLDAASEKLDESKPAPSKK
jgi:hypothetical protein